MDFTSKHFECDRIIQSSLDVVGFKMRINKCPSTLHYSPEEQEHLVISQKRYLSVDTQQELSQAFDWSRQQGLFSLPSELL